MGLKRAELPASDVKIYALVDPRDGRIRYIGKADDPARRLKTHLYESSARRTRKTGWIKSLRKACCQRSAYSKSSRSRTGETPRAPGSSTGCGLAGH